MVDFNAERFREAVLYVSWRMRDDERFGRLKLAKTLFYADFESYADDGQPVTGARYEHCENGPFPPALHDLIDRLVGADEAEVVGGEFAGDEMRLIPRTTPDTPHLSVQQRALLDIEMNQIAQSPSWRVSDESHALPAGC